MSPIVHVGIYVFDEVEVLDFAGPFEVFSLAGLPHEPALPLCKVQLVAQSLRTITARNGLQLLPSVCFDTAPAFDILIIPGGYGAEHLEIHKTAVITWIQQQHTAVRLLASVCTGAFLLAAAGLLDHKDVTTHWADIERLQNEYPLLRVHSDVKYIDQDDIITSGGISAGINMSFYVLQKWFGTAAAAHTAHRMEYDIVLA